MKLISFGDSWANGCELLEGEKPFGELIAKKFKIDFIKTAKPSTSLSHLLVQFTQSAKDFNPGDIALFFLTSPSRELVWDHEGNEVNIFPHNKSDIAETWYKQYQTLEYDTHRANTILLALQNLCKQYQLRDFYVWGWTSVELWENIDRSKFFCNGNKTLLETLSLPHYHQSQRYRNDLVTFNSNNDTLFPRLSGHPSQAGHQAIADILEKLILQDLDLKLMFC